MMEFGLPHVIAALLGYLLGSIPFGLLLTKLAGLGDIRSIGSGNIGATNVLRTGRKDLALATLLLDGGKGAAAVLIARLRQRRFDRDRRRRRDPRPPVPGVAEVQGRQGHGDHARHADRGQLDGRASAPAWCGSSWRCCSVIPRCPR